MQIILNGTANDVSDGLTLHELIEHLDLAGQRLAVEINEELVPRSCFAEHRLAEQDRVEIIRAVGGG